jgi:hypothetical protein
MPFLHLVGNTIEFLTGAVKKGHFHADGKLVPCRLCSRLPPLAAVQDVELFVIGLD